jgi:hypothetical protein
MSQLFTFNYLFLLPFLLAFLPSCPLALIVDLLALKQIVFPPPIRIIPTAYPVVQMAAESPRDESLVSLHLAPKGRLRDDLRRAVIIDALCLQMANLSQQGFYRAERSRARSGGDCRCMMFAGSPPFSSSAGRPDTRIGVPPVFADSSDR